MYEENRTALRADDASAMFSEEFAAIQRQYELSPPEVVTPRNVVRWGRGDMQPHLVGVCRRLLLPGSRVVGFNHLADLANQARSGKSCIVCLNHRSNFDVPTLCALLEDQEDVEVFQKIIWVAGRKLQEDPGLTRMLVQCFNQVIVTPRSWLQDDHSDEQLHEAHQINIAAHRAIHTLRHQGWIFALFPSGTRIRPHDESTGRAIQETDSYLKHFDFMVLGNIDGCTLPVSRDRDLTHEIPKLDQMIYTFGPLTDTSQWRSDAAKRYADLGQREASARAIMEDIAALGG